MIQTVSGKLYTGISTNLEKRFQNHLKGKKGARFFRTSQADKIVYHESHPDRSSASKRESAIKKLTRTEKLNLIESR